MLIITRSTMGSAVYERLASSGRGYKKTICTTAAATNSFIAKQRIAPWATRLFEQAGTVIIGNVVGCT